VPPKGAPSDPVLNTDLCVRPTIAITTTIGAFMKSLLIPAALSAALTVASTPAPAVTRLPTGTVKNIVLVHGAWADASSWNNVAHVLKGKGYHVTAVNIPLTSLAADAAATRAVVDAQDGPTVLVGHSWAGFVIGEVGNDPKVNSLVYVSAFAPEKGESVTALSASGPPSKGVQAIRPDDKGFLYLDKAAFPTVFGQDLPTGEAESLANSQLPINHTAFDEPATMAAWHSKPSWFVVSDRDQILDPSAQKFFANRIKATTTIVEGGHDTLIAFPEQVAAAIEAASRGTKL
jgi:pimeloyl-ACP methyl ester carboxylesterase